MRDDPSVVALVSRAAGSDEAAWHELVERYAPLVWAICVRHRLSGTDIEDVGQTVWLGLVEQLGRLREPAALPGWLATTTQRECLRVRRASRRCEPFGVDPEAVGLPSGTGAAVIEEEIIRAERNALLRAALAELPPGCRRLLTLLMREPPPSYQEVSAILSIRPGSIGPTRARCLQRLRRSPQLRRLADDGPSQARAASQGGECGGR